jgi:hypothetical protein
LDLNSYNFDDRHTQQIMQIFCDFKFGNLMLSHLTSISFTRVTWDSSLYYFTDPLQHTIICAVVAAGEGGRLRYFSLLLTDTKVQILRTHMRCCRRGRRRQTALFLSPLTSTKFLAYWYKSTNTANPRQDQHCRTGQAKHMHRAGVRT